MVCIKSGRRIEFSSHLLIVTGTATYFFFFAAAFLGAAFLAAGFFLAANFLAGAFFAVAFFAGAFLIAIDNPPFQSAVAVHRKLSGVFGVGHHSNCIEWLVRLRKTVNEKFSSRVIFFREPPPRTPARRGCAARFNITRRPQTLCSCGLRGTPGNSAASSRGRISPRTSREKNRATFSRRCFARRARRCHRRSANVPNPRIRTRAVLPRAR